MIEVTSVKARIPFRKEQFETVAENGVDQRQLVSMKSVQMLLRFGLHNLRAFPHNG
jgi:hypothetical protein